MAFVFQLAEPLLCCFYACVIEINDVWRCFLLHLPYPGLDLGGGRMSKKCRKSPSMDLIKCREERYKPLGQKLGRAQGYLVL